MYRIAKTVDNSGCLGYIALDEENASSEILDLATDNVFSSVSLLEGNYANESNLLEEIDRLEYEAVEPHLYVIIRVTWREMDIDRWEYVDFYKMESDQLDFYFAEFDRVHEAFTVGSKLAAVSACFKLNQSLKSGKCPF